MNEKSKGYCVGYISETAKIRDRVSKYLSGRIMDIGCGAEIVKPGAFGIDARVFPHTKYVTNSLYELPERLVDEVGTFDCVFSSHTLEHLPDDVRALREWSKFLKVGGFLVLYLPDDDYYDNSSNPEHLQIYRFEDFIDRFGKRFDDLRVVEQGRDVGHDRYSFYVVFEKINEGEDVA